MPWDQVAQNRLKDMSVDFAWILLLEVNREFTISTRIVNSLLIMDSYLLNI